MGDQVSVTVECYSGAAYGERPQAVTYKNVRRAVREILDVRQTPNGSSFRVLLDSGEEIHLNYDQALDVWTAHGLT